MSKWSPTATPRPLAHSAGLSRRFPDGWTTALWEGTSFAPVTFLRQMKNLAIDHVDVNPLSDADKMNGFEWAGDIYLDKSPTREAGEQGIILGGNNGIINRRPGAWSQWVDYSPMSLQVQKVKGQWQVRRRFISIITPPPASRRRS